jgi:hypothetical protein
MKMTMAGSNPGHFCFRFARVASSHVVPANAGTHTPCHCVLCNAVDAFFPWQRQG